MKKENKRKMIVAATVTILLFAHLTLVFARCANEKETVVVNASSARTEIIKPLKQTVITETENVKDIPEETSESVEEETESLEETSYVYYDCNFSAERQEQIREICKEENFSYELILSLMWIETRCDMHNGDLRNGSYEAIGYCQIWPKYWQGFAESYGLDIYNELDNIRLGCKIVNYLAEKSNGDIRKALQEYNTGDPNSNNGYSDKVFAAANSLKENGYFCEGL